MRLNSIFMKHSLPNFSTRILVVLFCAVNLWGCATQPRITKPIQKYTHGPVTIYGAGGISGVHDVYHVVGPSETLWRIGKIYDVDINTIMKANRIDDPTKINNGQRLLVPNAKSPKPVIPLYPSRRWTHIVIHHTATEVGNAFSIDQIHQKRGFWNGLGYHFLVDNGTGGKVDGQIEVGPRWIKQMQGAHANAAGMNDHGIGISVVGNYSETYLTQAELNSLAFLVRTLQEYYKIPAHNVIRHDDVPGKNTECPGKNFPWQRFKSMIRP